MDSYEEWCKHTIYVDGKHAPQFISDMAPPEKSFFDLSTIILSSFRDPETIQPEIWRPVLWEKSVVIPKKASQKKISKPKFSYEQLSMISDGICPFKKFPLILHVDRFKKHFCCEDCPGHDFVFIHRKKRVYQHHWVDQYDRYRDCHWETVRGHYRKTTFK